MFCLVKRVARPRIEGGRHHHFIFQSRPAGDATGSSVCNGHDPGANDDLAGGAHKS